MNRLSTEERTRVIAQLVEGCSTRTTVRITGVAKKTVMRLLVEVGDMCKAYCDKTLRNLNCGRLECDEIWSYCGCKAKNVTPENKNKGWGDAWCWVAIDPESKLIRCWHVGKRCVLVCPRHGQPIKEPCSAHKRWFEVLVVS